MYVYLRAAVRAVRAATRGLKRRKLSYPCDLPTGGLVLPFTCSLSSYSIFAHCTGSLSLSPSTPLSSATSFHTPSFSRSVSLSVFALSRIISTPLSLSHLVLSLSLSVSSSLVPSFVTIHLLSSTAAAPICCCCYVVATNNETSRCTRICVQKKRTPFYGT